MFPAFKNAASTHMTERVLDVSVFNRRANQYPFLLPFNWDQWRDRAASQLLRSRPLEGSRTCGSSMRRREKAPHSTIRSNELSRQIVSARIGGGCDGTQNYEQEAFA